MSRTKKQILHFTIGPVQGFIADARRLRDFWAGSFLLSWLAGHAMVEVVAHGGEIVFPKVDGDDLFEAIREVAKNGSTSRSPWIGSLPNRFKARVDAGFDPQRCKDAVLDAWRKLAGEIWRTFVQPVTSYGNDTAAIWKRQVENFWEIAWVIGDDSGEGSDSAWLDQRKNWRTHRHPDEPNDLCTLMGHYQELSGFDRIHHRDKQSGFWSILHERTYEHGNKKRRLGDLNLPSGERLCAIALIKRLFPLVAGSVLGWQPGAGSLSVINWPSTSYIAAVPWLKQLKGQEDRLQLPKAAKEEALKGFLGETETRLFRDMPSGAMAKMDGHLLHEDGIPLWVKENKDDLENDRAVREKLLSALRHDQRLSGGTPSEFYAVLIMDGDRIGAKIGDPATADEVKAGLFRFTRAVKDLFEPANGNPHDGVLVYAGGDDVLAFLPVRTAIDAAHALREEYRKAFEAARNPGDYTLSAAIIFTHFKNPMRRSLEVAHHYLDAVAKEENGRDSLAIAVMKPGGVAFDWVSRWQKQEEGKTMEPARELLRIAAGTGGEGADYSTGFLYNIRARYAPLFATSQEEEPGPCLNAGETHTLAAEQDFRDIIRNILIAEYRKQPGKNRLTRNEVEAAIEPLMVVGQPAGEIARKRGYVFEGALIARFLAMEGRRHLPGETARKEPEASEA